MRRLELTEKQKNCPYCHGICRAILEAPDFKLNVGCKDLICDFKKTGGWINPPINYCPMCGRPLGGNEDETVPGSKTV